MTMKNKPSGIYLWTGRHAVGKTSAALGCGVEPEKMYFVDADTKGLETVSQLRNQGFDFGKYVNMVEIKNRDLEEAYAAIWKIVDDVEDGAYDAVIIDPINPIYKIFRKYIKANTTQFDTAKEWSKSRGSGFRFYEGKISRHAREQQERFLNRLSAAVDTVQLTAHLKRKYDANVEVGEIPNVTSVVNRVASCSVWLRSNPDHSTPILLFIKPLGRKIVDGRIRTVNVTPRKATPLPNELDVWDVIARYQNEPAHDREPTPDETPDENDRWILEQTLNKEQKLAWFARIRAREKEEAEFEQSLGSLNNPLTEAVQAIVETGVTSPPAIKEKLLQQIKDGEIEIDADKVTLPTIAQSL